LEELEILIVEPKEDQREFVLNLKDPKGPTRAQDNDAFVNDFTSGRLSTYLDSWVAYYGGKLVGQSDDLEALSYTSSLVYGERVVTLMKCGLERTIEKGPQPVEMFP